MNLELAYCVLLRPLTGVGAEQVQERVAFVAVWLLDGTGSDGLGNSS